MKKIMALALELGLFSAVNVYAGSTQLNVSVPAGIQQGDTFDVDIEVVSNTGFTSFDGLVEYDPSVLKLVGAGDTDGRMTYPVRDGLEDYFITNSLIENMISMVPSESDSFYDGRANGKDTASAIGAVKLANYVSTADEKNQLLTVSGTGELASLKFQAIGSGSTKVEVKNTLFSTVNPSDRWHSDAAVDFTIKSVSKESTTEVTTAKRSSGGGGGGSSSSSASSTRKETTTSAASESEEDTTAVTEDATEATTEEVIPAVKVSFGDLSSVSWAVPYIEDLAGKGVVNGYADGTFKPNDNVKRCDFVVMLARALELPAGTDNFSDVKADAYYADAVSAAKAAGIVNGNGDGTFTPNSLITRQDMMVMAKGALKYAGVEVSADESALAQFSDSAEISAYAKDAVSSMVSAGIVNGTGGKVEPKSNTTRAQAAVIISKICENANK